MVSRRIRVSTMSLTASRLLVMWRRSVEDNPADPAALPNPDVTRCPLPEIPVGASHLGHANKADVSVDIVHTLIAPEMGATRRAGVAGLAYA
jgi:hypothetical protein